MRASRITPTVTAGQTYYIVVDGYGGAQGTFALTVTAPGSVTSTTAIATTTTSTTRATTTTTLLCAPPPSPTGLSTTTMSCQEVDLRWTLSSGTVSGYKVYRKRTTDTSYTLLTQLGATPAFPVRDTTASGSSAYSYGVAAFNQGGSSPMATALVNTPTCPSAGAWIKQLGGTSADQAQAVTVGANGDLVVVGYFSGTMDFGGTSLTAIGTPDLFIARYTAAGALLWAKRYGGIAGVSSASEANAVAVDASGNIVVAGDFWGRADFGTGPLTAATNQFGTTLDMFVAKYSSSGTPIWSRRMGGGARIRLPAWRSMGTAMSF